LQAIPESRIPYVDESADHIAAELVRWSNEWQTRSRVAEHDGRIVGFVGVDVDLELNRAWIHGPFVEDDHWDELADDLLRAAVELARVDDLELLGDGTHVRLAQLAQRHGFPSGRRSLELAIASDTVAALPDREVPRLEEQHRSVFVALHDSLFPRTYYSGAQLVEQHARGEAIVLTLTADEAVVGYAVGRGRDSGGAYLDFVGVGEHARGRGYGRTLTIAICKALLEDPQHSRVVLTVYDDNATALALYDSIGFTVSSSMIGYRRRPEIAD
jgi:ribosomal protein S18 acetylase RimI-like enzyme